MERPVRECFPRVGVWGRGGAGTHHEFGYDPRNRFGGVAVHEAEDPVDGEAPDLAEVDTKCGQRRDEERRLGHVVEADDADILRNPELAGLDGADDA